MNYLVSLPQALGTTSSPTFKALTLQNDGIGVTSTDGVSLVNSTAAAAGAQQYSPRLRLTGQGWKTNATAASQTVDFICEVRPVQGAAAPTANLVWAYQVAGGGYTDVFYWSSAGGVYAGNGSGAAPSFSFTNFTGQGFYATSGQISMSLGSSQQSVVWNYNGGNTQMYLAAQGCYIQGNTAGSIALLAGGTNQSITVTPSGTGASIFQNATSKATVFELASDGYARIFLGATATTASAANSFASSNGSATFVNGPSTLTLQVGGATVGSFTSALANFSAVQLLSKAGTVLSVGVTVGDADGGMYRPAANQIAFATAGVQVVLFDASQNSTFAGQVSIGGGGGFRCAGGYATNGASQAVFDYSTAARVIGFGADVSTNGIVQLQSKRSDGSNTLTPLVTSTAGTVGLAGAAASATAALTLPVGTTGISSLRVPHGAAPTSPVDGDIWSTTTTLNFRLNGVTKSITMT